MDPLVKTLYALRQLHGKHIIRQDRENHPVIRTGWREIDSLLDCGGWPRGRIVEIYGPSSSGKTTVALRAVASVQAQRGRAVFVDAERTLNMTSAVELGVDVDEMILCEPDTAEAAFDSMARLISDLRPELVVVDSLAALVPQREYDDTSAPDGNHAALIARSVRQLGVRCSRSMTCLLILNQVREKVDVMFGNPFTTPGGNALRHASYLRLEMRPVKHVVPEGMPRREFVKAVVTKSKCGATLQQTEFELPYGLGVSVDNRKAFSANR